MSREEEAIAKMQLKGNAGIAERQKTGNILLNERILIFVGGIAILGICVVWATAKSAWVQYGSFALVIVLTFLWGIARVKRMERIKQERAEQAKAASSVKSES